MTERPATMMARLRAAASGTRQRAAATDWWSVAIELFVVIAGILIAFELNEWDQRRQARAEEQAVIRHLAEEAAADIRALGLIRDEHRASADYARLLALAVSGQGRTAEPGPGACSILRLPAVRRHSAAGLEASERTALIEDAELRHLIRRADAERLFNESQLDYFREAFNRYGAVIEPYIRWPLDGDGGDSCRVDRAGLAADPLAVTLLPKVRRDQLRFALYRQRELDAIRAVAARVECNRAGTCPD